MHLFVELRYHGFRLITTFFISLYFELCDLVDIAFVEIWNYPKHNLYAAQIFLENHFMA